MALKRKNPILRTRQPTLPPAARSRAALGLTAAAAEGRFALQACRDCGTVQYPPREACQNCLSLKLVWKGDGGGGDLISDTTLHHSNDLFFRERLPWRLGLVKLDSGPTVVAHLHAGIPAAPVRVTVSARLDRAGQAVIVAFPDSKEIDMANDTRLREFGCDPRHRKVLVTDGKSAVGQALVKALAAAGAELIWVGHAEPWKKFPGFAELEKIPQVTLLPLDVTDTKSVQEVAAEIGGKVDILVSNAELHRAYGIANRAGVETARAEMDVNYFGLLRLAQHFGGAMRARGADGQSSAVAWGYRRNGGARRALGADGQSSAVAWVNLLSIYALANFPPHGTFSASKAAAHSLSQCLRAEMRGAGIRVVNVFPGPIDDEWNQLVQPPKVTPDALARAVVGGLKEGVEDLYPGDVAQEWLERWRDNPKALEKELSS